MKKFLAIMLALAIIPCVALFTGCGSNCKATIKVIGSQYGYVSIYVDGVNMEPSEGLKIQKEKKGSEITLWAWTPWVEEGCTDYQVGKHTGKFVGWSDGSTENPREIILNKDIEITAFFRPLIMYSLFLDANDENMGTVFAERFATSRSVPTTYGLSSWEEDTKIDISAEPESGYHFVRWSDGSTSSERTITINDNMTLKAIFAPNS